jgi:hypothetical protein
MRPQPTFAINTGWSCRICPQLLAPIDTMNKHFEKILTAIFIVCIGLAFLMLYGLYDTLSNHYFPSQMSTIVATTQPMCVEYGGVKITATLHVTKHWWLYNAEVKNEQTGNWEQFASGVLNCREGANGSPAALKEITEMAGKMAQPSY